MLHAHTTPSSPRSRRRLRRRQRADAHGATAQERHRSAAVVRCVAPPFRPGRSGTRHCTMPPSAARPQLHVAIDPRRRRERRRAPADGYAPNATTGGFIGSAISLGRATEARPLKATERSSRRYMEARRTVGGRPRRASTSSALVARAFATVHPRQARARGQRKYDNSRTAGFYRRAHATRVGEGGRSGSRGAAVLEAGAQGALPRGQRIAQGTRQGEGQGREAKRQGRRTAWRKPSSQGIRAIEKRS